ncbi:O-methyltransferase-domain-containing protein [Paraphysoderma sedebokerense]|nr:O-methyltransferase-domain-containing protein [Paraphysoderma sedebokerense]
MPVQLFRRFLCSIYKTLYMFYLLAFDDSDSDYPYELATVPAAFVRVGWKIYSAFEKFTGRLLPPAPTVLVYAQSFMVSKCLHVVVVLNIPDLIKNNPMDTKTLAEKTKVDADRLGRVMTLLYSHGMFKKNQKGQWCNNRLTATLRADHPASVKALVEHFTDESYMGFEKLLETVKAGGEGSSFDIHMGESFWTYLDREENDWRRERFAQAMICQSNIVNKSLLVDFNWSQFQDKTICDVGGGFGGFSAELLRMNPSFKLILFDRPKTAQDANQHWKKEHGDLINRVQFVGGDFFKKVPANGDVYFLRTILHDWSNPQSSRILRTIHSSIPDHRKGDVRIVIADLEVTDPPTTLVAHVDMQMLAIINGRERSKIEMDKLLEGAGFKLVDHVRTKSGYMMWVAKPVA